MVSLAVVIFDDNGILNIVQISRNFIGTCYPSDC